MLFFHFVGLITTTNTLVAINQLINLVDIDTVPLAQIQHSTAKHANYEHDYLLRENDKNFR